MTPEEQSELQQSMADVVAGVAPLRDAVAGYRESLIRDNGFSDTAAEQMAVDFHHFMVQSILKSVKS